ncbi:MAG: S-layer homology domain-containing protein [Clostridiales bacterium]|nr:S-layer homology domain-containing protein [Eubacteriales bacterium]MDH7567015.1 S-layer homology domain-containing protein [Clostridiales bacterium]
MKKSVLSMVIATIFCLMGNTAFAHGVIYDQKMVGENTLRVTLKWSDPQVKKVIVISSYTVREGKYIDMAYEIKDSGKASNIKDFDLRSFLPPVCIRLHDISDYNRPVFADLKEHYAEPYVHHLHDAGIINGKTESLFYPEDRLTRAEFMAIMVKALKLGGTAQDPQEYKDIEGHWAKDALLVAVKNGLITGYPDKTLRPDDPVTLAQVSTVLSRAFTFKNMKNGIYDKLKQGVWYSDYIKKMFDAGILKTSDKLYESFNGQSSISRADCAMMVSRAMTR